MALGVTCSKKKKKKKNRRGRQVRLFSIFCHYFFFFRIQREYETLKQNLVEFKHSSHELRSQTISVTINGTEDAYI